MTVEQDRDAMQTESEPPEARGKMPLWATAAALVLIALGAAQRIRIYAVDQSFWWDEAMLADNMARRDWAQLLQPLDHNQAAPAVFLLLCKASLEVFGHNEYAARLVPLVASLIGLGLFWLLAKRILPPGLAVAAMGMAALGRHLCGCAAEYKQYASDAMVATLILLTGIWAHQKGLSRRRLICLAVVGAAAVWMSHPAIFLLPYVGLMLVWSERGKESGRRIGGLLAVGVLWAASFAGQYFLMLRSTARNGYLERYWGFAFAPLQISSWMPGDLHHALVWPRACLLHMFEWPGGFTMTGLAAAASCLGIVWLWRSDRKLLLAIAGPILVAILASGAHLYPFHRRTLMFAVPSVILLVFLGVRAAGKLRLASGASLCLTPVLLVLLLAGPLGNAVSSAIHTPNKGSAQIFPSMKIIRDHWREGDVIYAHWGLHFTVKYYSRNTDRLPGGIEIVEGTRPRDSNERGPAFMKDLARLSMRRRVWVLAGNLSDAGHMKAVCHRAGRAVREFPTPNGVTTLLVDLGDPKPPAPAGANPSEQRTDP